MSRLVSFWVLLGVIFVLVIVFFKVMATFLVPMFLASILCVMFGPLHQWMRKKCRNRQKVAAALTTSSVVLAVLVPGALVVTFAILESREIIARLDANSMKEKAEKVRESLDLNLPFKKDFEQIESALGELRSDIKSQDWHEKNLQLLQLKKASQTFADHWQSHSDERIKERFTSTDDTAKQLFDSYIQAIDTCLQEVENLTSENDTQKELEFESNYRSALTNTNDQFQLMKTDLLGGRFWAAAKELANPTPEDAQNYSKQVTQLSTDWLLSLGGATTSFLGRLVVGICIMVISMYFFLLDGPKMIETLKFLSPMDDAHEQELLDEFQKVSRAVVVATLLSAVVQGILAGLGYYFCGVGSVFLLMLLTTILALVPFVGAAAVWFPASLWLYFVDGRPGAAIILFIYGAAIVSTADNVIKPFVLHGQSNLHPLLALLSVLGGVTALGPIGILVGPMIVVFLQTLLKILQRELTQMDNENESENAEASPAET